MEHLASTLAVGCGDDWGVEMGEIVGLVEGVGGVGESGTNTGDGGHTQGLGT